MSPIEWRLLPDTAAVDPTTGHLTIAGCDTLALAEQFGTPLFVYDEAHMRAVPRGGRRVRCRQRDLRGEGVPLHGYGSARP